MKRTKLLLFFCCIISASYAQETFPVNGVHDYRTGYVAFTHATIVKDSKTTLKDATLINQQAETVGASMPLAALAKKEFEELLKDGFGDFDWSALALSVK